MAEKEGKPDVTLEQCQDAVRSIQEELLPAVEDLFMLAQHFENCDPLLTVDKEKTAHLLGFTDGAVKRAYEAVNNALGHTYGVI